VSIGFEAIVIGTVVLVAVLWAVRAAYRSVNSSGGCSSCSSSGECPLVNNPDALAELTRQGQATPLESCHPQTPSCTELLDSVAEKKQI
jgi:hypothetical protein